MIDEDFELGRELGGFASPVFDKGCWANDEAGTLSVYFRLVFVLQDGEKGEGLDGFAEAHFVGKDAAKIVLEEMIQPRDSGFLVVAKRGA